MEILGTSVILLTVCLIFLILNINRSRRPQGKGKLPPGPTPLPILGNILQLYGKEVSKPYIELSKKYGPVYTIYIGSEPVVVLCSCDVVKEALNDNGEDFADRALIPVIDRLSSGGQGVVASNGERWKKLRRFCLMTLRDFGMGKRSIEERIRDEAQFLTEEIRNTKSQPVDPTFYFGKAVSNIICSVVFGERFDYEDKEFLRLLGLWMEFFRGFSSMRAQLYNIFPKLISMLPGTNSTLFDAHDEIIKYITEKVKMHHETLDPNSPRDIIDCFLIKMEQEKSDPQSEFHMEGAVNTITDLFGAGTETVNTTLRYGLLVLLKHPDVEERVHKEIDQVIGRNRAPCVEDRTHMPYTDAVIHEIQRFINLLPLSLPHKVSRDIRFRDYVLPKDTTVFPILGTVLQDPKQFKYPHLFHPGHFLDKNGKFYKNDGFMPFSAGKRLCLGQGLAYMELFLFFTTILQNFILKSEVDTEDLDLTPEISGLGNVPRPYQLCFIPR
ncbi:cytochrome P450 2C18-like [Rhinophrynus dorsalis]